MLCLDHARKLLLTRLGSQVLIKAHTDIAN